MAPMGPPALMPGRCSPPAGWGRTWAWLSGAGMPAVADPAARWCAPRTSWRARGAAGGPGVAAPGVGGQRTQWQNFAFVGYLPQDAAERAQRLRQLETLALKSGQAQLFIETPYRNAALWQALLQHLQPGTRLATAAGLTLAQAQVQSRSVAQWRALNPAPPTSTCRWCLPWGNEVWPPGGTGAASHCQGADLLRRGICRSRPSLATGEAAQPSWQQPSWLRAFSWRPSWLLAPRPFPPRPFGALGRLWAYPLLPRPAHPPRPYPGQTHRPASSASILAFGRLFSPGGGHGGLGP